MTKGLMLKLEMLCDVPAKALIKYTTGHTGYFSCSKCETEGIYLDRRACFPQINNLTMPSDPDFRSKKQIEHHTGTSILEEIPGLDMIAHFPLDYMHLVCLGIVKKMIVNIWMNGKPPLNSLSEKYQQFQIHFFIWFHIYLKSFVESQDL